MALVLKQEPEPDADCFGTHRDAQVQRNGGIYLIRVVFTSHRDAIMFKISKTFPSRKSKTNKTILLLPIPILSGGLSHGGSPLSRFAQPKYLILLYVYGCVCTFGRWKTLGTVVQLISSLSLIMHCLDRNLLPVTGAGPLTSSSSAG